MPGKTALAKIEVPPVPEEILSLAEGVKDGAAVAIHSAEDEIAETDRLAVIQTTRKKIEEARVELKAPHLLAGQQIDATFNPLLKKLDTLIGYQKLGILRWKQAVIEQARVEQERVIRENEERERRAQADMLRSQEEARGKARQSVLDEGGFEDEAEEAAAEAKGDHIMVVPTPVIPLPRPVTRATIGRSSLTKRWTFTVEDKANVPMRYLMVDEVSVRADIAGANGIHDIPGLRIYEEESISGGKR